MSSTTLYIVLIFVFICISGVFAAAEMALVSLRESQVKQLTHRGKRGHTVARLTSNPNRFLSAVQVGVTLSGFLSAAFGGATLAAQLSPRLVELGLAKGPANTISLIAITVLISYVSIVVGELAAKRLALQRAEAVSMALAPLVDFIATLARPVIWLLGVSTNVVVKLLGGDPEASRDEVSDEEIRALVSGSSTLGDEERQIVDDVFDAGARSLREVMVPRTEVDFLPGDMPAHKAVRELLQAPHSRYPVMGESADDVVGFVHVRDLFNPAMGGRAVRVRDIVREVFMLPATRHLLSALTDMRREGAHLAIVVDEYGGTAGIITLEDLVEEIIGDIKDEYDEDEPETTRSLTGEIEVDGLLNLDDFKDETALELPEGPYETVAGYIVQQLGHVPAVGEAVIIDDHELKVAELDGRRVARVTITPPVSPPGPRPGGATAASAGAIPAVVDPVLDRTADPSPDRAVDPVLDGRP